MSADEIAAEFGRRLRAVRLQQGITQQELAARASVSAGTLKNLESRTGACSLNTVIRVAQALGLSSHFESLFVVKPRSIAQMAELAQAPRRRARRKARK